jgi:uncharacterized protein (DUF983 family)
MKTLEINKDALNNKQEHQYHVPGAFKAALYAKCPRCRRGNMFATPMYGLKLQKMNVSCSHCNMKFEREPGYFYVAMFISYAFNVAQMITIAVATYVLTGNLENMWLYFATIFPAVFLLSPFNYRYSRVVLLYWLTPGLHYAPEMSKDNPNVF